MIGGLIERSPRRNTVSASVSSGEQDLAPRLEPRLDHVDPGFARSRQSRPLLIIVPLYRRPDLAVQVIESLCLCAADIVAVNGEVVLHNDSPDDVELGQTLERLLPIARRHFPCRLMVNDRNIGFIKTCNTSLVEATARGYDALLLNSDTIVTPGALTEMVRVSRIDPMVGFVNPRSNNATLATLPFQDRFRHLPLGEARRSWEAVASHLPATQYVPTAIGFCMLIRWGILAEFGVFDEIYGLGFNEENDLCMRAGRRGYRAILANHAFVWHMGSGSFSVDKDAAELDRKNRTRLLSRYPEYLRLTDAYFSSPELRAEFLMGCIIPDEHGRLDVAFDFSSFVAAHNGTFEAGAQLLAAASTQWRERFNLFILCDEHTYAFHDYSRFGVERRNPHGREGYAAIFRVGQPFEWGALDRLAQKAMVYGVFMLDTIAMDCSQLAEPQLHDLWNYTVEHADFIATTSELTGQQLERRVPLRADVVHVRSLHSLDLADYRLPTGPIDDLPVAPGYIFVVGNHYWHKDVVGAVNALASADRSKIIVVLGSADNLTFEPADKGLYAPRGLSTAENIVHLAAGQLSEAQLGSLYRYAAVVVVPSHYEGFGMPMLNALAAERPVFVRPLPVFEEIVVALGGDPNVHVFATTADLVGQIASPPQWTAAGASSGPAGDADRAARDIETALVTAIAKVDYWRIVRRIRALHTIAHPQVMSGTAGGSYVRAPATPVEFASRAIGQLAERGAAMVLNAPGVFALLRFVVRRLRSVRRIGRSTGG